MELDCCEALRAYLISLSGSRLGIDGVFLLQLNALLRNWKAVNREFLTTDDSLRA